MTSISASTNTTSVVQTAGTVPERQQQAPVSSAASPSYAAYNEVQKKTRAISEKVEESVKPTREAVQNAAKRIESFVKSMDRDLSFSLDETSGHRIIRVTDPTTGELIRQMPSDETLRIAKTIDYLSHALVSQKA